MAGATIQLTTKSNTRCRRFTRKFTVSKERNKFPEQCKRLMMLLFGYLHMRNIISEQVAIPA